MPKKKFNHHFSGVVIHHQLIFLWSSQAAFSVPRSNRYLGGTVILWPI